jgi:thiol-disulfide isomerase/thioredoxin
MTEFHDPPAASTGTRFFIGALLIVAALAAGFAILISSATFRSSSVALQVGESAPPINAAGWLNGEPFEENAAGRVTFVHAWYTSCPHCRTRAPELRALYERYRDQGVVFIGLTFEEQDQLAEIRDYVQDTGLLWPNGYGAGPTLRSFGANAYPFAWVIGPDGRVLWNSESSSGATEAIELALQATRET